MSDDAAWSRVADAASKGERIKGRVAAVVRGGLILDLNGIRAFLPAHLVEREAADIRPPAEYEGATLEVAVIELNRARNNCVVSRAAAID